MTVTTNEAFLQCVERSFKVYLDKETSRSTAKLKVLHGFIAQDLARRIGPDYTVFSQGYENGKEARFSGRYQDKAVDIAAFRGNRPVGGIAVKFIMQNYKQNSVNYFENMLGETANVRCNGIPYFHMLVLLDRLPYFGRDNDRLQRWEIVNQHNIDKYLTLSRDSAENYLHTPNKTLIFLAHPEENEDIDTKTGYFEYYREHPHLTLSTASFEPFEPGVILNDYDLFLSKVSHAILAQ